jgi:hypothetical protein
MRLVLVLAVLCSIVHADSNMRCYEGTVTTTFDKSVRTWRIVAELVFDRPKKQIQFITWV